MKVESAKDRENRKKKRKQQEDWFEKYVLSVMEKSLETAMNQAFDEIFKGWK